MKSIIGLNPIIDECSRILILGSMPSKKSLELKEYYGNHRNHFWRIMESILDIDVRLPYSTRIEMLLIKGLTLWDVIQSCVREGSLDKNIKNAEPNDLRQFLLRHKSIQHVFFNGQKPRKYIKSFTPTLLEDIRYGFLVLPSSSPSNTQTINKKVEEWKIILQYCG